MFREIYVGGVQLYEGNHLRHQMLKENPGGVRHDPQRFMGEENHKDQATAYWPFVTFLSVKL